MNNEPIPIDAMNEVMKQIEWLIESFSDDIERKPTLGEFIAIISQSPAGNSDHIEFVGSLDLIAETRDARVHEASPPPDLDDSTFAEAAELQGLIGDIIHTSQGRLASSNDLASAILQTLNATDIEFHDISGSEVSSLTPVQPQAPLRPKIGDILSIPSQDGGYYFAVVIARNKIGIALGLFRKKSPEPVLAVELRKNIIPIPIYTDDRMISKGVWDVVGHDEVILAQFPRDPEVYYSPDLPFLGIDVGEFGSAKSPTSNVMRHISRDEARVLGILDGTYRQSYPSPRIPELLDAGHFHK